MLLLFLLTPVMAQVSLPDRTLSYPDKKMEKLLDQAVKKGMGANGAYRIENKANAIYSGRDVREYVKRKGYYAGVVTKREYNRFGELVTIFDYIDFYTEETKDKYAFSQLCGEKKIRFEDLKKNCLMFCPVAEERYVWGFKDPYISWGPVQEFNHIYWSGNVVDGLIDGHGIGFCDRGQGWGMFEADFRAGIPVNNFSMDTLSRGMGKGAVKYYAPSHAMVCSYPPQAKGNFQKALREYAKQTYASDVKKLDEEYERVKGLNNSDYKKFESKEGFVDNFIRLYGTEGVDPGNNLSKARGIKDVYTVLKALGVEPKKWYRTASIVWGWSWMGSWAERDSTLVNKAASIVQSNISGPKSDMYPFYSNVSRSVSDQKQAVMANINAERKAYLKFINDPNQMSLLEEALKSGPSYSEPVGRKSCRVRLYFKDKTTPWGEEISAGNSNWNVRSYKVDKDGWVTIWWNEDERAPEWIHVSAAALTHWEYTLEKLKLSDGGVYEFCLDCK